MKRGTILAAVLAAGLVLAGCSSSDGAAVPPVTGVTGTPSSAASTTTDSPTTESSATESSATESSATDSPTSTTVGTSEATTSGSAVTGTSGPSGVDENTIVWFTTVCSGLSEIQNLVGTVSGAAPKTPKELTAIGKKLSPLAKTLTGFSTELEGLEPPSIEGGESAHQTLIKSFGGLGSALDQGVATLSKIDTDDQKSVTTGVQKFSADLQKALTATNPGEAMSKLPNPSAEVQEAVRAIPECAGQFG